MPIFSLYMKTSINGQHWIRNDLSQKPNAFSAHWERTNATRKPFSMQNSHRDPNRTLIVSPNPKWVSLSPFQICLVSGVVIKYPMTFAFSSIINLHFYITYMLHFLDCWKIPNLFPDCVTITAVFARFQLGHSLKSPWKVNGFPSIKLKIQLKQVLLVDS